MLNDTGYEVSARQVRSVMKHDLKLSFLKSKKLHPGENSAKVMIQRQ